MTGASDLVAADDSLSLYVGWVARGALPVWASAGFDLDAGRFRERLDRSGASLAVPHRAMVQARQIYVYTHAAQLGWFDGAALAERAMAGLLRDFCDEGAKEASFAFSIDPAGGRIVSDVRDAYTHAFALFALAWQYRLTGEARLLTIADKVIAFVERQLVDGVHGGVYDAWPATDRSKRQNPLMHLLEAYLFLEQAAPGRGALDRADVLVRLFRQRLFKADPGVLLEHFSEDWAPHPDPAKASAWEPGHHFEWVWLLAEYGRLTGQSLDDAGDALYASAMRHGLADDGAIRDELDRDMRVLKPSHRVWPHTEGIKAAVSRTARGDADARDMAGRMAAVLLDRFLDRPFPGGWIDHVSPDGAPLVDYVPASSLYHLFLAASEAAVLSADGKPPSHAFS